MGSLNSTEVVLLVLFLGGLCWLIQYAFAHEGQARQHSDNQEGPKQ